MELEGIIKMIGETQTFGGNGFRKRELVVTTNEQYPQHILTEFVQDKCDLLDNYKVGDGVKVGINIRGRLWVNPQGETKYFNSIQGWRIDDSGASAPTPVQANEAAQELTAEESDDLPF